MLPPGCPVYGIAVGAGTVLAAGDALYLLRRGATSFAKRPHPREMGDVHLVAVEPRRPSRIAVADFDSVTIFEGERMARVHFEDPKEEIDQLAWSAVGSGETCTLLVLFGDGRLLSLRPGTLEFDTMDVPSVWALATDEACGFAVTCFDEENEQVDVYVADVLNDQHWRRSLPAPGEMFGMKLAVAGDDVAMSFHLGGVWLSRRRAPFVEVEGLTGGGPVAFQGAGPGAALFGVARDERVEAVVRIALDGTGMRIAEVEASAMRVPSVQQLAWDLSRQTVWAAAGPAGIVRSTVPGDSG
jgi:hypothetical protein